MSKIKEMESLEVLIDRSAACRICTEHFGVLYDIEKRGPFQCFYPVNKDVAYQTKFNIPDVMLDERNKCWHFLITENTPLLEAKNIQKCYGRPLLALVFFLQRAFPQHYQDDPGFKGE